MQMSQRQLVPSAQECPPVVPQGPLPDRVPRLDREESQSVRRLSSSVSRHTHRDRVQTGAGDRVLGPSCSHKQPHPVSDGGGSTVEVVWAGSLRVPRLRWLHVPTQVLGSEKTPWLGHAFL